MTKQFKRYIYIAVFMLIIVVVIYLINFYSYPISKNTNNWGAFGAYLGGVAGAFLTLLTVVLLIKTLDSQNKYAVINQFESSFFELLKLHKEITDRIIGTVHIRTASSDIKDTYKGLKFFEKLSEKIMLHYNNNSEIEEFLLDGSKYDQSLLNKEEMQKEIDKYYNELYLGKESELGHYFRSLYHLVKFVDGSSIENKKRYIDLIQAYLTDAELHCTFYNGIAIYGRERFKPLLDKYSFLENIKPKGKIFERHFELFYPKTFIKYTKKPRPSKKHT